MNFFKRIIKFIGLSSLPLLVIYPINLFLLDSGKFIDEQSGFYPSLAIFSLALEFGISSFIVSSRLSAKYFIKSISSFSFTFIFLLFATAIFLGTCHLFNFAFVKVWDLYIIYLTYAYFGLCTSIARGIYDRSKNFTQGLRVRYINQFGTSIALMLSLLGTNDYITISFVSICRLPYFFVIIHFINRYKHLSNLNKINMSKSLIKSMIIVSLLTFLTDYLFRLYLSISFSLESIIFFSYAADIIIKVSGFLLGAIQPFYFSIVKYVSEKGIFLVLLSAFLPIFGSNIISTAGIIAINFIQGVMLQNLISKNKLFYRKVFFVYQLILFIATSYVLVKINGDLLIIDHWLFGQILCTALLFIWNKNK
jgi:hypothetical protein